MQLRLLMILVLLAWQCCGAGCSDGAPAGSQTSVGHGELDDFVPPPLGDLQRTVSVVLSDLEFPETVQRPVDVAVVESGGIRFRVTSNSRTPQVLSGLESLSFQDKDKRFEAFRAGLNLEHVYCGHRDVRNRFSPRKHTYLVSRERDGHSVFLVRPATQSPWSVEHATPEDNPPVASTAARSTGPESHTCDLFSPRESRTGSPRLAENG